MNKSVKVSLTAIIVGAMIWIIQGCASEAPAKIEGEVKTAPPTTAKPAKPPMASVD